MCVFICGGRSEGFVHVWVFRFGRLHMCLCLRREGTREGGWCLFCFCLYMCVEGGRGGRGGCSACKFEGVQEFVFILRGDPGGRFWLVLFLCV